MRGGYHQLSGSIAWTDREQEADWREYRLLCCCINCLLMLFTVFCLFSFFFFFTRVRSAEMESSSGLIRESPSEQILEQGNFWALMSHCFWMQLLMLHSLAPDLHDQWSSLLPCRNSCNRWATLTEETLRSFSWDFSSNIWTIMCSYILWL